MISSTIFLQAQKCQVLAEMLREGALETKTDLAPLLRIAAQTIEGLGDIVTLLQAGELQLGPEMDNQDFKRGFVWSHFRGKTTIEEVQKVREFLIKFNQLKEDFGIS